MDNNTRKNLGIRLWAIAIILIVGGVFFSMFRTGDALEGLVNLLISSWGGFIIAGLMISGTLFLNNSN